MNTEKIQIIILKVFLMKKYKKDPNFASTWVIEMDIHSKLS